MFDQEFQIMCFDIEHSFGKIEKKRKKLDPIYKYMSDNYRTLELIEEDYFTTLPKIIKKIEDWIQKKKDEENSPDFTFEFRKSKYIPPNNLMIISTPIDCMVHTEFYSPFWRPEQRPQVYFFKAQGITTNANIIESFQTHFDIAWRHAVPYEGE
ncbi:MAG: hypothetical protein GF364_13120 [Candidatus Lokiarchaeota archaeon]|nr:hypothetical protein [Candidatus Lokiarchaeota archaeon]